MTPKQLSCVSDLYDSLEDLMEKVEEHCRDIPLSVQSSLYFANYALLRAKAEGIKNIAGEQV